ncbi:MAG: ABC transporter permease [Chloroflexi bacterium]|nr:ABC transporter permease [Chloroflexota bacterium]
MTARSATADLREARLRPGWITIAAKEFTDHLLSARLYVLLIVLGIAALIPLYFAADQIRSVAASASITPAIFLFLFRLAPEGVPILRVDFWISIAAPLLGVAFAFDAINGERHEGTLPRLLSQPIHRDDVINGKFVAGLAIISTVLVGVVLLIAAFGLFRLGIAPAASEIARVVLWLLVTILYVAFWLAFGLLLSVVIRRAATSALVAFGTWLFVAVPFFGPFLIGFVASVIAPDDPNARHFIGQFLPSTLYGDITNVILNPTVQTTSRTITQSQYLQAQNFFPDSSLSVIQSLVLIWPAVVTLFALTIGCFALAYVRFMRQEVRA